MRKRIVAVILALGMTVSLVSCGERGSDPANSLEEVNGSTVTRGEWVVMLTEAFGLDTYEADTPTYSDIAPGNTLYNAVQSAAGWGILAAFEDDHLSPDKKVSREEVASSAALATGFRESERMSAVDFAVEHGIITGDGKLSDCATPEECSMAISAAKAAYLGMESEEDISVELSDKFIDLSLIPADRLKIDGEEISIFGDSYIKPDDGLSYAVINGESYDFKSGSIFVLPPSEEHPFGVARKISGTSLPVQEEMRDKLGLTYKTKTPELGDLYNELVVHKAIPAELDKLIWADGVSVVPTATPNNLSAFNGGEYRCISLSDRNKAPKVVLLGQENVTVSKSFDFSLAGGEYQRTWKGRNSKVLGDTPGTQILNDSNYIYDQSPSIEDFHGNTEAWTKSLEKENKFSAGYQITGNITINAITVKTDIEYHKFDLLGNEIDTSFPEAASLQVISDISSSLKLEGNMSERVKIATVPIPIAATGLTVSVDLYLYADISGTLQITTEIGSNAKVEWRSPTKLKRTAGSHMEAKAEAALNLDFGADLSAGLDAFGSVKIMDMGAKVGGELTADAYVGGKCELEETDDFTTYTYTESMNLKSSLFAPIASIYVGGPESFIEQAGLSGSWDIMSRDRGAKEYELVNEEWVFWRKTVKLGKEGNVIFEEETPLGTGGDPMEGDFSEYAGVYQADEDQMYNRDERELYGIKYPDVVLHEDGTLTGGTVSFETYDPYPEVVPYFVEEYEGGLCCHLVEGWVEYGENGNYVAGGGVQYFIFPAGIPNPWKRGDEDTSKVRLYYSDTNGGAFDAYYTKTD